MKRSPVRITIRERIFSPLREFIRDSRSAGLTLICCTIVSLVASNSSWGVGYLSFWHRELSIPSPELHLPHTVLHLINDGLMTLFFFLVGLELKRELLRGELSNRKKALLPAVGAMGGMIVPALLFLLWCKNTEYSRGWGIPIATDIAFSLGILSLLGKKAPLSLRIFLTALAIIDDLGGILTIALFYAGEIHWDYLLMAGGILLILSLLNLFRFRQYFVYFLLGIFLWYALFNSGVHATIAGVLLALTIPLHKIEELEHALHDPVSFLIMPLFALANTAFIFPEDLSMVFSSVLNYGIMTGLVLGKPVGIFLFSLVAVRLGVAALPTGISLKQLWGAGMIAGIGFTISIFMATLAFNEVAAQVIAKTAVIAASVLAGLAGFLYLKLLNKQPINKKSSP